MKSQNRKLTLQNTEEITKVLFKNDFGRKVAPFRKFITLDDLVNHVQDEYKYYRGLSDAEKEKAYNKLKRELSCICGWDSINNYDAKVFNMSLGRICALIEH